MSVLLAPNSAIVLGVKAGRFGHRGSSAAPALTPGRSRQSRHRGERPQPTCLQLSPQALQPSNPPALFLLLSPHRHYSDHALHSHPPPLPPPPRLQRRPLPLPRPRHPPRPH